MVDYVSSALFVHTADTEHLSQRLQNNAGGVDVTPVMFDVLMQDPQAVLEGVRHVVVSAPQSVIKTILRFASTYGFSVGVVPMETQKNLIRFYDLPKDIGAAIDLALQTDAQVMDLILCNGNVLLFKATMGLIPALDAPGDVSRLRILTVALRRFFSLKLHGFDFKTAGEKHLKTAACGCMIIQHHKGSLASRVMSHDSSFTDTMISTVVSAPISILQYLAFLVQLLKPPEKRKRLPSSVGYIKSPQIDIESEPELKVYIDGEHVTHTPLHCETLPRAVRINIGAALREDIKRKPDPERMIVDNLPRGKELVKAQKKKKVPFFSYASEERFRDLFISLRDDAKIDGIYLTLMVLSTLLATVGLYLDSASVIIGAMLLAPLMAPIVSLSMGILRNDERMLNNSLVKIFVGISIALLASGLITLLFPHKPITGEMQARLNPTLLDLGVAIISGVAAAYSKSFKEIIQSLAGVAIAVALVPPLAVAGIGIGRLDFHFFYQAFLLFSTNLVGIVVAANFTFRVLGYSPAIRNKRNLGIALLLSALIAIPLYLSYDRIVDKIVHEKSWQKERFLVNGKYIIVQKADITQKRDKSVVVMDILARELLTREDLTMFRNKIQRNFDKKLIIRVKTIYIP
jgi:uncharacterized hydrophobic protein (TIGR00271 family)